MAEREYWEIRGILFSDGDTEGEKLIARLELKSIQLHFEKMDWFMRDDKGL